MARDINIVEIDGWLKSIERKGDWGGNFEVQHNMRKRDPQTGEWGDDTPVTLKFSAFRETFDALEATVAGRSEPTLITVTGHYKARQYEWDGEQRTSTDLVADVIALKLRTDIPGPQYREQQTTAPPQQQPQYQQPAPPQQQQYQQPAPPQQQYQQPPQPQFPADDDIPF